MIHYHVWFNLKTGISEDEGLATLSEFLAELCEAGQADRFQILKNSGKPPRSKLATYHALIEFVDSTALAAAMKHQVSQGIHTGAHGKVVDSVSEFRVEVFSTIPIRQASQPIYSCEI